MDPRDLPSVDRLVRTLDSSLPRGLVVEAVRTAVANAREALARGEAASPEALAQEALRRLSALRPTEVLNATGVLLHTNLGRAPLHPDAAEAARRWAIGYGNLELDLTTGRRGGRGAYLVELLTSLTGAESGLVVNNNAGGLFLTLAALASGREVPVSRGELIEIGGSYRLPELMAATGARLVEVGTTNRTRSSDYRAAVGEATALILKVHPSNYRIVGFSEDTPLGELTRLGREAGVPVVFDVGSGLLDERTPWLPGPPPAWLSGEPGVVQSLARGADLVLFSGDKLLGGPQAGVVVGRVELIDRLRRHPVARALRLDGPTVAALTVTLEKYAEGTAADLPLWRMALTPYEELERRAESLAARLGGRIVEGHSTVGAGSVPGAEIPSPLVAVGEQVDRRFLRLLASDPPVVARREGGVLLFDLRTVPPDRDSELVAAVEKAWED
jgi:L-seryl-tRNA(Ser) seleniumtransferase